MTPRAVTLTALALALAGPLAAQDSRLQTLVFDENAVVRIEGRVKVQTTIKFAPDEVIENVAIGDSAAWQVQPNKAQTILFVKPLEPAARTNMTVVTDKRTYLFDLVASPRNSALCGRSRGAGPAGRRSARSSGPRLQPCGRPGPVQLRVGQRRHRRTASVPRL